MKGAIAILGVGAGLAIAAGLFTLSLIRRVEARYPPVGKRVDIGAGAIHVVETPPRATERASVLLVHGASGNFADLHVALAGRLADEGFRVFSVDRPGHGWSDRMGPRAQASSPEQQAQWLRLALQRLGVREAIVVVHSLAGVLGLAMALNAPEFTRGLVLLAPVSHPWPGGVSWYYGLAASPRLGPLFRWLVVPLAGTVSLKSALRGVFAPNPTPENYSDRTRLPLVFRPAQFLANAEDVYDIAAHVARLSPRYGEIRTPTAIVTGDSDGVVYAHIHSTGSARDIPGATLTVLPGIGHSPHYSAPEAALKAILDVDARAREGAALDRAPARASHPA